MHMSKIQKTLQAWWYRAWYGKGNMVDHACLSRDLGDYEIDLKHQGRLLVAEMGNGGIKLQPIYACFQNLAKFSQWCRAQYS